MAEDKFDVEQEFERLTDLIEDNTYPGDFSCSGWSSIPINCAHFKDLPFFVQSALHINKNEVSQHAKHVISFPIYTVKLY